MPDETRVWRPDLLGDPAAQAAAVEGRTVVSHWPEDPDGPLKYLVADLDRLPELKVFVADFDHYGSGYASFVEVGLTRRDDSLVREIDGGIETQGFGLLLNRLAPIAVAQADAHVYRHPAGHGSGSLPNLAKASGLPVPTLPESATVLKMLEKHGYGLVDPTVLSDLAAPGVEPDTNLGRPPWTVFDAWFYWFD